MARTLGIKRAVDAQAACNRGMRKLPEEQRKALYQHETERLDQLEARIRSRDAAEPEKLERHLVALGALRDAASRLRMRASSWWSHSVSRW